MESSDAKNEQPIDLRGHDRHELGFIMEKVIQEIIRGFAAYTQEKPELVLIYFERKNSMTGGPWEAKAQIDHSRETVAAKGGNQIEATWNLRGEVMLHLRRRKVVSAMLRCSSLISLIGPALILALAACGHGGELPGNWYTTTISANTARKGGIADEETLSLHNDGTYGITGIVQWGPAAESRFSECTMYVVTKGQWITSAQGSEETLTLQPDTLTATLGCLDARKTRADPFALPYATATYRYEVNGNRMTLRDIASPQVYLFSRAPQ